MAPKDQEPPRQSPLEGGTTAGRPHRRRATRVQRIELRPGESRAIARARIKTRERFERTLLR